MGGSKPFCSSSSQVVPKEYLRVKECRREEKPSERRRTDRQLRIRSVRHPEIAPSMLPFKMYKSQS